MVKSPSKPPFAVPITDVVAQIPEMVPFVGPEAQVRQRGRAFRARLGANENGFGPSPKAIAAMKHAAAENWMYADPESDDLRTALAKHHGVAKDQIVIGEGIDGLLGLTVRLFVEPGVAVATSDGAYPTFNFHVVGQGGALVRVPYRDDHEDLEALVARAKQEEARVIYVSNPDNPMGSMWDVDDISKLIDAIPETTLLILDEAYCETAPADRVLAIRKDERPNVIRFRTFSKAYGLAGARIGYAIGTSDVIGLFEKVRNHYGINRVGQIAALAALTDQDYLHAVVEKIVRARQRISDIARENDLQALPSATNFVTIDCGRDGAFAEQVMQEILARDVFVRKPAVPGLDRCIRVSVGPDAELDIFAEVLRDALKVCR